MEKGPPSAASEGRILEGEVAGYPRACGGGSGSGGGSGITEDVPETTGTDREDGDCKSAAPIGTTAAANDVNDESASGSDDDSETQAAARDGSGVGASHAGAASSGEQDTQTPPTPTMILVLLLRPPDRIFEVVELPLPPSTDGDVRCISATAADMVTVGEVLNVLVPSRTSQPALRRQAHAGLCRYRLPRTPSSPPGADDDRGSFGDVLIDPSAAIAPRDDEIMVAVPDASVCSVAACRSAAAMILRNLLTQGVVTRGGVLGTSASASGSGTSDAVRATEEDFPEINGTDTEDVVCAASGTQTETKAAANDTSASGSDDSEIQVAKAATRDGGGTSSDESSDDRAPHAGAAASSGEGRVRWEPRKPPIEEPTTLETKRRWANRRGDHSDRSRGEPAPAPAPPTSPGAVSSKAGSTDNGDTDEPKKRAPGFFSASSDARAQRSKSHGASPAATAAAAAAAEPSISEVKGMWAARRRKVTKDQQDQRSSEDDDEGKQSEDSVLVAKQRWEDRRSKYSCSSGRSEREEALEEGDASMMAEGEATSEDENSGVIVADVDGERAAVADESSVEPGDSGRARTAENENENGDLSTSVPHLDAVLAVAVEDSSGAAPAPRDERRGEDALIRQRMVDDAPLIDGEQVVAIGEQVEREQGCDGDHDHGDGGGGGRRCKNQRKRSAVALLGGILLAAVVIVSLGVVFSQQQPQPQPVEPPPSSTATEPPTATKTSVRFDRFREAIINAYGDEQERDVAAQELAVASSPQRRALQWLADEDEYAASVWSDGDEGVRCGPPVNVDERAALLLQRYALAVLFFATGGGGDGNWTSSCGFLEPVHECEWYEDTRDDYDRFDSFGSNCSDNELWIKEIRLPSNNLVGTVPEEMRFLPQLEVLYLYSNLLGGTVPTSIGTLTELVRIELDGNELTGSIPTTIGNLHKLQFLVLYNNLLKGPIPSSLGSLSELLYLDLDLNSLTGELPEELGNLSKLEWLSLAGNDVTGPIPESIGQLSSLKNLDLHRNALSGTIPPSVNNLSELEWLDMDANILSGSLPFAAGGGLPFLQYMYLSANHFTGTIPEAIFTYTSLRGINLLNNNLTGTVSPNIANLTDLRALSLSANMLSGSFPLALTKLGALEQLGLGGNRFVGTLPSEIGALQNLTVLGLSYNEFTGTLPDAMGNISTLITLWLGENSFRGTIPRSFAGLTSLVLLDLSGNNLEGDLNVMCDIFNSSKKAFAADCHGDEAEVLCNCCNVCCSDDVRGPVEGCFPA